MNADKVLKQMLLSEKSSKLSSELGQYTFEVFRYANKHAIAEAVEKSLTSLSLISLRTSAAVVMSCSSGWREFVGTGFARRDEPGEV